MYRVYQADNKTVTAVVTQAWLFGCLRYVYQVKAAENIRRRAGGHRHVETIVAEGMFPLDTSATEVTTWLFDAVATYGAFEQGAVTIYNADRIECPACKREQSAKILWHAANPAPTYAHRCECGYVITQKEWKVVVDEPATVS